MCPSPCRIVECPTHVIIHPIERQRPVRGGVRRITIEGPIHPRTRNVHHRTPRDHRIHRGIVVDHEGLRPWCLRPGGVSGDAWEGQSLTQGQVPVLEGRWGGGAEEAPFAKCESICV